MTGPVPLEDELARALSVRADAVTTAAAPAARAAVDRRLAHRQRRRLARRAAVGGAAVVVLALVSSLGADRTGVGTADRPDVVAEPESEPGPVDDPARWGLPCLALDPPGGLRLRVQDDPVVRVEAAPRGVDALAAVDGMRVVRPAGALVPAVFTPLSGPGSGPGSGSGSGPGSGSGSDESGSGEVLSVDSGDADADDAAVWTGRATGWSEYDAGLADPAHEETYGFGVSPETLADITAGRVPRGFVVHEVAADPDEPATVPAYELRYEDEDADEGGNADVVAGLRVWAEGDLRREVALLRVLAGAEVVATVEVDGRPAVMARHPGGPWSVGWSPAEGVTAALIVGGEGIDRAQVAAIAESVRTVDADEWAALAAEGRG